MGNIKCTNELWFIKPDFSENQKNLVLAKKGSKDWEYKSEKKAPYFYFECIRLEPAGKPPAPRNLHTAAQFCKKYLAIFGGRNDAYFS